MVTSPKDAEGRSYDENGVGHTIKIDRSFVAATDAMRSRRIVGALVSLGGVVDKGIVPRTGWTGETAGL